MSDANAKTIQIFLPDGNPQGIRVAEITTRIVQVIEVPRSRLAAFLEMDESSQVAVYFLVTSGEEEEGPSVYVGQTGELRSRLPSHNKGKDFWERVLVLISRTNSLTQTHALFLESHAIQEIAKAERYRLLNGNSGSRPHTPAPLRADCLEIHETGRVLLATLGFPLFEAIISSSRAEPAREEFFATGRGCNARGVLTDEGFVVLAGSVGRRDNVPSLEGKAAAVMRARLLETGVTRVEGDTIVFTKNQLFRTPGIAGAAVLGRPGDGGRNWKTRDGRTLEEVRRAAESTTP